MTEKSNSKLTQKVDNLQEFSIRFLQSISFSRWIGYGFLLLSSFDLVETLLPLYLMNPLWEFNTLGNLVEHVPVPLIGLVLVFHGNEYWRYRWEIPVLKFLSWFALLLGILFLLLIPLGIVNTIRIDRQNATQINYQVKEQMSQIQQIKDTLARAETKADIEAIGTLIDTQERLFDIKDFRKLEQAKTWLSNFVASFEKKTIMQAEAARYSRRLGLLKRSIKWNLGALVAGVLFIYIWRGTGWLRF
ncbi:HpsJ family protein [Chlorogloeopsis sp. ULAP01]|uniref:HpsJ-like protein, cyanoexosortase A-associated n=1 Tax=Chlorogloeopsis sp. ULAP01 TaxID=3056483 RepID=UPI0025AA3F95|nr:HpsJ family protein [Chlorogloeopsis sp. ULAP01]MDM9379968.1 HpsJ family protein [Chlorogloeopsis sp. ULAP01]